jgi:RHS repeat-associated protein
MIRPLCSFFLLIVLGFTAASAFAQGPTTGTPPFGSFGGGPDIVNLANLNTHWTIPIRNKPGRGTDFIYILRYDASVWYPVGFNGSQSWQPVYNWGWLSQSGVSTGYVTFQLQDVGFCTDQTGQDWPTDIIYTDWVYYDPFGVPHSFNGYTEWTTTSTYCPPRKGNTITSLTATAADGSGYVLSARGSSLLNVISKGGIVYNPPVNTNGGSASFVDRNGNQINVDGNGNFTDTLGTTALAVSGAAPSNTTFTYTSPSGALAAYTMKYTTYTIQTKFGCSGITEFGSNGTATASLVSEIDLPDWNATTNPNSRYTFVYETTPNDTHTPHYVTGRLASVTLPTGGTISYVYSGGGTGVNGITCADGSAATLARTTSDGTWSYAQVKGTGAASTTTITDPQNNQTVVRFQGIYETQRQVYQGSTSGTLLRTWNTCYNGSASPCTGTAVTLPISQRTVVDQNGSSGLQCKHNYLYNSVGGLTEQDDYDYGSGGPGALLKKTLATYAPLGNITAFQQTVTVCNATGTSSSCNGTGTPIAQTNYNYDETTPTATSGVAQHISVTGSRGNLTSINYPVSSLTAHFSYWDTGSPNTQQDVNGATTTYNYSSNTLSCQMAFPTSISEPVGSMSRSFTWNCAGSVQLTATDENGKTTNTAYANDPYFWRPDSVADPTGAAVSFCYGLLSSSTGTCTRNPTQVESTLNFNSNNSTADSLVTLDNLGRPHVRQTRQSPSLTTFDSAESDYDTLGRSSRGTLPYSGGAGQTNPTGPAVTTAYDALARPTTVTDAGGGTTTYSYSNNDVLVTVGPAPSGENTKQRQLEYDSLGRLTSVCEITSASGSGTCGQNSSQTGYWTKYVHDALGNLTGVTQNAQAGSTQTRGYSFDAMSRLTSETNPENGTTTYTFDTDTNCGTSSGDLVKHVDAYNNVTCYAYDALHRQTSITYPSGPYASPVTPSKYFVYDSATVNSVAMANVKSRLAEAYTCTTCPGTKITDLGFSYTARGEVSDVYELTPHSSPSYYHVAQTYWPHGAPSVLSATAAGVPITGFPNITYGGTIGSTVGLDGEGRITQVTASGTGQQNPVTGVTYNNSSLPTQVTFGSADTDIFAYDSNTMRISQYQFNINGQSSTGALTWNSNGSLQKLVVTDAFNSSDNQTCNYSHDDLSRIAQADCGTGGWGQSFAYDPFGNITKNVLAGHSGNSFQPTYSPSTNRFATLPGFTPTYDANGNVLTDGSHTYAWDADGNSISLDGVGLTFDALDRMVEQNRSGTYTEIVYSPGGAKLALMSGTGGQTLQKAFVPLPGQAAAVYTSSGLDHYRHSDWLGSARLTSSPSRGVLSTAAYAPFGETYAQSGTADLSFTGENQDSVSGNSADYDFLYREYSNQGRWVSPDPAGLAAVTLADPQSLNRYVYVRNRPLSSLDPLGLTCFALDENGNITDTELDTISNAQDCSQAGDFGGFWISVDQIVTVNADGSGDFSASTYWDSGSDWGYLSSGDFSWQGSGGGSSDSWLQTRVFFQALENGIVYEFTNPDSCLAVFREASAEPLHAVHHAADVAEQAAPALIAASLGASSLAADLFRMSRANPPQLDPFLGPLVIAGARAFSSASARVGLAAEHAVSKYLPVATVAAADISMAWGLGNEIYATAKGTCH